MNFPGKWMRGRNGADPLGIWLMLLSLLLMAAASFLRLPLLSIFSFPPMLFCFYRILSRDIPRRSAENRWFLGLAGCVRASLRAASGRIADLRTHRHFACPKCRKRLRVPRGKGRIRITCPGCGTKFEART